MTQSASDPIAEAAPGLSLERWSATSGSERPSRANLVLFGGGHRWRANADGNGAVDALMRAVDRAVAPLLDGGVLLVAYDVHATGIGHEARASISVRIRRAGDDSAPLYLGRADHDNVLHASVAAYVDAINALIANEGVNIASTVPPPGQTPQYETDPDHRASAKDRIMAAYNS